ncbi:MAG: DUF2309 domain-containing protein [Planctomycetota bacterium]
MSPHTASTLDPSVPAAADDIRDAVAAACARIAPTWPLDRFIAVNPLWNRIDRPLPEVAADLRSQFGARLAMPRAYYRDAYREGRLRDEHLQRAIDRTRATVTVDELRRLLGQDEPAVARRSRVTDVLDAERDLIHEVSWCEFVTTAISQYCAAYFDEGQATFGPSREGGLFASWRRQAQHDRGPALLMHLDAYREAVAELPASAADMARVALAELDVPAAERAAYLSSLLLNLNGWASWCMYRRWMAEFRGERDDVIEDLLGVRLAWEWLLFRTADAGMGSRWRSAMQGWARADAAAEVAQQHDWLFQEALEIAWQSSFLRQLPDGFDAASPRDVAVQAAFCIDVRSEVFRRALEAESPGVQTLGFAGFFGMPIEYQQLGAQSARPQLPGPLSPALRVTDTGFADGEADRRRARLAGDGAWNALKSGAVSTFVFVEAMGLTYAGKLLKDTFARKPSASVDEAGLCCDAHAARKPRLTQTADGEPVPLDARCDLAAGILRGMSLTHDFARLVLLAGHGSESRNNPHAAGLDCGACCGQSGEVNARATVALFNDPRVREGLAARGIDIPATTHFLAGQHNTTTDEFALFDLDELPATHADDVAALRGWLEAAGARARAERARRFDFAGDDVAHVHDRARDWAQVRPEWGLVNNAAFLVAPREHSRHLDMEGRVFLHDYRWQEDDGFTVLEQIMTAPMVVTHWINFQYYASTVDNRRYGSGNKVLHNVVGGHIGVFEGNGGDLRTGLPMQSLHDGERWVHTPLRLSVFLEAPRTAIEDVLHKHEHVRSLVANGWLHLFQIDGAERAAYAFRSHGWVREEEIA